MFLVQTTLGLEIDEVKRTAPSGDTLSEGIYNPSFSDGVVDGLTEVAVGLIVKLSMEFLVFLRLGLLDEPDDIFHHQTEVFVIFGIHS